MTAEVPFRRCRPQAGPSRRDPAAPPAGAYAAWVAWVEDFRRGDDREPGGLCPLDGRMGSYLEARLLERLSGAFSERVRAWQRDLGQRIVSGPPTDAAAGSALLREAGPRLDPLARVAAAPQIPRAVAGAMHALLGEVRAGARASVEESHRRHREPEREPRLPRRTTTLRGGDAVTPGRPAGPVVPSPRAAGVVGRPVPAVRARTGV